MTSTELQRNFSKENGSRKPFKLADLHNKLDDKTFSRGDIKTLRVEIGKSVFEENNVGKDICESLFGNETQINAVITSTLAALVITTFSMDKEGSVNKRTSLGLYSNDKLDRCDLFVANSEPKDKEKMKEKGIKIRPEDYSNIAKAIEATATEKGLVKQ